MNVIRWCIEILTFLWSCRWLDPLELYLLNNSIYSLPLVYLREYYVVNTRLYRWPAAEFPDLPLGARLQKGFREFKELHLVVLESPHSVIVDFLLDLHGFGMQVLVDRSPGLIWDELVRIDASGALGGLVRFLNFRGLLFLFWWVLLFYCRLRHHTAWWLQFDS